MDTPLQEQWAKKSRFLTQALIFSGALNIGLLTSFFYFILHEKKEAVSFELKPVSQVQKQETNTALLGQLATMSYGELLDLLSSEESVEEGYKKRDLALASLVTFHFVNLEKALPGFPLQKRVLSFQRKDGPEQAQITVYPGLGEDQFHAVHHFLKTEKFPFTTEGLFFELQHSKMPRDPSLLSAFQLTPEFISLQTLFSRSGLGFPSELLVELLSQGDWNILHQFSEEQKLAQDLSPHRLKALLSSYIRSRSLLAAKILVEWDRHYISKSFSDADLTALIDLFPQKTTSLEFLLKHLLVSARSDAIRKKAGEKLGMVVTETPVEIALEPVVVRDKSTHKIQAGENLWKIARRYKVSIEALRKANHLESDKLRVGKEIVIPKDDRHRRDATDGTGESASG